VAGVRSGVAAGDSRRRRSTTRDPGPRRRGEAVQHKTWSSRDDSGGDAMIFLFFNLIY
jgi:hypothetical protein